MSFKILYFIIWFNAWVAAEIYFRIRRRNITKKFCSIKPTYHLSQNMKSSLRTEYVFVAVLVALVSILMCKHVFKIDVSLFHS